MLKKDVFDHFQLAANVARALGVPESEVNATAVASNIARVLKISPAAVFKWGAVVPYFSAVELERITEQALRVDADLYERGRPKQLGVDLAVNQ